MRAYTTILKSAMEMFLVLGALCTYGCATENGNIEQALRLTEKALADAQYAEAKTRAEKAKELVEEVRLSVNTLRDEIDRARMTE